MHSIAPLIVRLYVLRMGIGRTMVRPYLANSVARVSRMTVTLI